MLTSPKHLLTVTLILVAPPLGLSAKEPMGLPKPTPSKATEPLAKKLSFDRAATYLDQASMAWLSEQKCASCHTSYPYLLARTAIGDPKAPALLHHRKFFEDRIAGWDRGEIGAGLPNAEDEAVTEIVATATTLALHDRQTTGKLHPRTRQALAKMWTLQRPDGIWTWNQHFLPPQEDDEYYGAVYAAIGVGHAPQGYSNTPQAKKGLTALRNYFARTPAPSLHHKLLLAWASLELGGLMTPKERTKTFATVRSLQRKDGGWNLPSLGDWKRLDGKPNDTDSPSDGYSTGLILYILHQANEPRDATVKRGLRWLETHQRRSGRWFTRSLNADRAHYITNAGTAYCVLALKAWNPDD